MIYTSFYASRNIRTSKYVPVQISLKPPRFPLPYEIKAAIPQLMPGQDLMARVWSKAGISRDEYEEVYLRKLDRIGPERIQSTLQTWREQLHPHKLPLVLLCFENLSQRGQWCHRTMFASWYTAHTGERVVELG